MMIQTSELKKLEEVYGQSGNQIVLLYGRDNCQKEQLIKEFCKEKKFFYYRARQASEREQVLQMGQEVETKYGIRLTRYSYDEFFNRIKSGDPTKLVVVIDEFQYIARKDVGFMNSILKLKAKKLYPGPVMIILTSSSLVWVEEDCREKYGEYLKKVDAAIRMEDATFLDVVRHFPEYGTSQAVQVYGIIGGVPGYLTRWNSKKSIKENVCRHILSPDGFLFHEAENYISIELRELSVYNTILAALASGNNKLNDLFLKTGFSRAKISVYMKNLMAFDVVEKVVSFDTGGWENTKKGVYRIANTYVNFWFRFVYPHLSDLYMMAPEEFYDTYIEKDLDDYMNRYFVKVCREYLTLLNRIGKLPIDIHRIGTWVGKKGNIDIVAQNSVRESIVGICNWSEPYMTRLSGEALLDNLKQAKISAKYLYMFSAQEFAEDLKQMAEEDKRFVLIDMKEL
ncbi:MULTISPECIES: ATP-binding protein [unclassified Roseburia]|uniref:ATP-binding protein n=1 Tax=unclassified Roseburia TaxID=2637578 RepID=UPI000E47C155|nr:MULTISPECIES: ATP-binding protein [unclassified Roseburia]RGI50078.1 ATP-binding protein [Roseburia sp. OM03-7AC]RGI53625.1 ATP-binding protein [Roseburia sp. OM03-18]